MVSNHGDYEYDEFFAEYYDITYEKRRSEDIEFYIEYSRKARGRTLELGCGTGRVLIPTAVTGCEITGLDLSPYMLEICREKLAKESRETRVRTKLVRGNMTSFNTGKKYKLVTIPFRPFQHLITVEEQKKCLNCVRHQLTADGRLVFDVFNPNLSRLVPNVRYTKERDDVPEKQLPDGRKVRRAGRVTGFHREQQYNDIELIYYVTHPSGKTQRLVQQFPMRYYFRYELEHLLDLCGFKVIDLFGDFDGSALTDKSPEMIFVAKRKD